MLISDYHKYHRTIAQKRKEENGNVEANEGDSCWLIQCVLFVHKFTNEFQGRGFTEIVAPEMKFIGNWCEQICNLNVNQCLLLE